MNRNAVFPDEAREMPVQEKTRATHAPKGQCATSPHCCRYSTSNHAVITAWLRERSPRSLVREIFPISSGEQELKTLFSLKLHKYGQKRNFRLRENDYLAPKRRFYAKISKNSPFSQIQVVNATIG